MIDNEDLQAELAEEVYAADIAAKNDAAILAKLNAKTIDKYGELTLGAFSVWMTFTGVRARIKDMAVNFTHADAPTQAQLRNLALDILDIEKNPHMSVLDFADATTLSLLDTLVAVGTIQESEKTILLNKSIIKISRAQELFGVDVTLSDISFALRGVR